MDLDSELAFLRCLPFARPGETGRFMLKGLRLTTIPYISPTRHVVGKHRHFRMIALQGKIREMTGVVLACEEIWAKLGELYSLEDLDEMVRTFTTPS